jgi:hypothetical protein
MPTNYPDLHLLDETDQLLLGHTFEVAVLICKRNGAHLLEDDFYGDPSAGLISPTNEWAVVVGEHVTVWHHRAGATRIAQQALRWVRALRLAAPPTHVELLVDPWGANAAIWRLEPAAGTVAKVRDFSDYRGQEHTEHIVW